MAFINKKEEVIKLRLTQHGKSLLSRGLFSPHSYSYFDDDIIYDPRHGGVEEHQNAAQDRIKTQARRDIQHLASSAQERHRLENIDIEFNIDTGGGYSDVVPGEFDNLVYPLQEKENDKILGFPLTNMALGTQELPRFSLSVFESEIDNHASIRYEDQESARISIPQLDFSPEHVLVRDTTNVQFFNTDDIDILVDSETFEVNPIAQKIEFADGSFLEHHPESVTVLLEEFNVPYLSKNFEIEVFEIKEENSKKKLCPINNWESLFEINLDTQVTEIPEKKKQRNNFF